ncbi:WD domain-containing protein [Pleurostoma richardsiae]|uniref:WD domain-containing protein n=1 Tax=Pleurostoma richardsiae TaxID=41990 RepID=A0AA38VDQ1_9PEZI|nr:WD domain-containing protein [Pleurostoma richardsiae]
MAYTAETPLHSRNTSSVEYQSNSVFNSPQERRQSRSSMQDPSTPLRNSFGDASGVDISMFSGGGGGDGGGGLGNLADELADAFSDSEDGEYYENGNPDISVDLEEGDGEGDSRPERQDGTRDSGVDVASPKTGRDKNMSLSLPAPNGRGHRRAGSEYDGSEYGSESDLESPGMPPSLVAKIDAVESLARRGTEANGGPNDGVFGRVTEGLRDLGSQAGVEGNATRLITAHAALTTHLAHQTRQLHNLTFPLFSPLVAGPDPETIEELLPELLSLSDTMPRPSTAAYQSLSGLHALTSDLVQTLNYLSDTLHMSRQTTNTAARRLKSAKELVAEMRHDEELRDEGERWLARGNWGERLKKRECAAVCGDVVSGFEDVCNSWRARLLATAEAAGHV